MSSGVSRAELAKLRACDLDLLPTVTTAASVVVTAHLDWGPMRPAGQPARGLSPRRPCPPHSCQAWQGGSEKLENTVSRNYCYSTKTRALPAAQTLLLLSLLNLPGTQGGIRQAPDGPLHPPCCPSLASPCTLAPGAPLYSPPPDQNTPSSDFLCLWGASKLGCNDLSHLLSPEPSRTSCVLGTWGQIPTLQCPGAPSGPSSSTSPGTQRMASVHPW